ncbi:conserved hypothetical protein [Ricinus communis]|uniref:Uncharacterized protein n=1 Tax=Ricinus communis TaxID=3988 RepID=B9RQ59_RICCO|nr:conserved hypothetical protein [Ricinus communis]
MDVNPLTILLIYRKVTLENDILMDKVTGQGRGYLLHQMGKYKARAEFIRNPRNSMRQGILMSQPCLVVEREKLKPMQDNARDIRLKHELSHQKKLQDTEPCARSRGKLAQESNNGRELEVGHSKVISDDRPPMSKKLEISCNEGTSKGARISSSIDFG